MSSLGIPPDYGSRRRLALQAEATALVSIGPNPAGRDIQLAPGAAQAWTLMKAAAKDDGITLVAHSGFRSVQRQAEIIHAKLKAGVAIEDILKLVAAPGYSEHHTGRAVDIGVTGEPPLTEAFAATPAFAWLGSHAARFGFRMSYPRDNPHGISYEPWHWYYRA